MKTIISILSLCFVVITSHSQIITSDKFELSNSDLVYSGKIAKAPDLVENDVVLKFGYDLKKKTIIAKIVNLYSLNIESEKTLVLNYKFVSYTEDWCIHAKENSYLIFTATSGKVRRLVYVKFDRRLGEFSESIVEFPLSNDGYDTFNHIVSPDSTLIARMETKDLGSIAPVNGNVKVNILDTEQNLKLVRTELFEDKTVPAEGKGEYLTGLNYNLKISNAGKIALLKSIAIDRGGKVKTKIEKYNLLFRSDDEGIILQNLLDIDFNARVFNFFFAKERLVMVGLYNTNANMKGYKGYFMSEFNSDFGIADTKFIDFPNEFHTKYYSTETDDFKDTRSNEEGHIHSMAITEFKQLSDGNYFVVCEKIYYKNRSGGTRRHNQNVYLAILSPDFKLVKNFVVPKYLYDSNYGRGTVNSDVLIGKDHIFVFTQEDVEVQLPKNEREAISLTRAALTSPNYVCYKINIQDGSIERYALLSIKTNDNQFEFFPKEVFLNENEEVFSWMFFPAKKGYVLFKMTLN